MCITSGRMLWQNARAVTKEKIPNVTVNAHNYLVSFQVGVDDDDFPEDSEAGAARAVSPRPIPGRPGPGPGPPGNMHIIFM